jgi:hypothetical protein
MPSAENIRYNRFKLLFITHFLYLYRNKTARYIIKECFPHTIDYCSTFTGSIINQLNVNRFFFLVIASKTQMHPLDSTPTHPLWQQERLLNSSAMGSLLLRLSNTTLCH